MDFNKSDIDYSNCTNAWISGKWINDILLPPEKRGSNPDLFYNAFIRINGVEDKVNYVHDLLKLGQELKSSGRSVVIVNNEIPAISESVKGDNNATNNVVVNNNVVFDNNPNNGSYDLNALINSLTGKIISDNDKLQHSMRTAFSSIASELVNNPNADSDTLKAKLTYLVSQLSRYKTELFKNYKDGDISCFIHMGACKNEDESIFIRMISRMPVDVLILVPDKEECLVKDTALYEKNYDQAMTVDKFPEEQANMRLGTMAYHAERELDTLLYKDSGIYRDRQFRKVNIVTLQTMYEEIDNLWQEDIKYRPYFSTGDEAVSVPVIFSKISGVEDGNVKKYWKHIQSLINKDTFLVSNTHIISYVIINNMKKYAVDFYENGVLQRDKILSSSKYKYKMLKTETQELILEKLELLINQNIILPSGDDYIYNIIASVLSMPKEIVQMIQNFDFTKRNPKILYVNTEERTISYDDSILLAFLNLIGFDILLYIPTGYISAEKYYNGAVMEEHHIGEFVFNIKEVKLNPKKYHD